MRQNRNSDVRKEEPVMKITFLGASHGVPEPHRRCSCTMIEVSGRYYFVDMGCPAIDDLITKGIPVDAVKAIFITHHHGDHTDGLLSMIGLCAWYFKTANPEVYLSKIEQADAIRGWLNTTTMAEQKTPYFEVKPGVIFDDGFLKVTAIATKHCDRSYAYLVEAEGKTVLFTGDLGHPDRDFPEIIKGKTTDLVVCEGAHFPVVDYLPHFAQCDIKKVCVNHYAPWNIPHIQQLTKDMGDVPVTMVSDGMEVTL